MVVGLGALGSFALRELAHRGLRPLGLDRYHPPHTLGSSHGRTRIIRAAYFEHPLYVPLVQHAWKEWHALESQSGTTLFRRVGALMVGDPDGEVIRGTLASARLHGIPHRRLSARELRIEVPRLRVPAEQVAIYEEGAGVLFPERAIEAALADARSHGAEVRTGTEVTDWVADDEGVTLTTSDQVVRARRAVLAAGPWLGEVAALGGGSLASPPQVERQVSLWFESRPLPPLDAGDPPRPPNLISPDPDRLPVVLWEFKPNRHVYLIPDLGDGIKAALHHGGEIVHPDTVSRQVEDGEEEVVRSLLDRLVPGVVGRRLDASVCLYSNTPDRHFLVGPHPAFPQVTVLGGGSGHAFKFAPALGQRVADLVQGSRSAHDLGAVEAAPWGHGPPPTDPDGGATPVRPILSPDPRKVEGSSPDPFSPVRFEIPS